MPRITKPTDIQPLNQPLPSNGKTILIAEDDPFISRMYETKLKTAGYTVVVKNNGRDAYEEIKNTHPDLLILDINMPELSGLEVLAALKNDSYDFATSPAIVLTNSAEPQDRATAEKLGAEFFVKAELTPRDVVDRINNKLNLGPATNAGEAKD